MIIKPTKLQGAYVIEPERLEDKRGFFARVYCGEEFRSDGLNTDWEQCNISFNKKKGTLRGMHLQLAPHDEIKLVRCTMGAIYDVIVDLRPESGTFKQWLAIELTYENRKILYIPKGFAHGFQTLMNDTEVFYQISVSYHPEFSSGIRWDDPSFDIKWPNANRIISERDLSFPDFVS